MISFHALHFFPFVFPVQRVAGSYYCLGFISVFLTLNIASYELLCALFLWLRYPDDPIPLLQGEI